MIDSIIMSFQKELIQAMQTMNYCETLVLTLFLLQLSEIFSS